MFEQDYIVRLIREMIRAILKLVFHIDTDNPVEDLLEDRESQKTLEKQRGYIFTGTCFLPG